MSPWETSAHNLLVLVAASVGVADTTPEVAEERPFLQTAQSRRLIQRLFSRIHRISLCFMNGMPQKLEVFLKDFGLFWGLATPNQ